MINNRATLDTSINFYGTQFPLEARTDKTPIIDDVTFARSGAYNTPSFSQDRRWHYNTNLNLYADHHDMKIGYMYPSYTPAIHGVWRSGAGRNRRPLLYLDVKRGAECVLDRQRTGMERERPQEPRGVLAGRVSGRDKLRRSIPAFGFEIHNSPYPEQRFGLNGRSSVRSPSQRSRRRATS